MILTCYFPYLDKWIAVVITDSPQTYVITPCDKPDEAILNIIKKIDDYLWN